MTCSAHWELSSLFVCPTLFIQVSREEKNHVYAHTSRPSPIRFVDCFSSFFYSLPSPFSRCRAPVLLPVFSESSHSRFTFLPVPNSLRHMIHPAAHLILTRFREDVTIVPRLQNHPPSRCAPSVDSGHAIVAPTLPPIFHVHARPPVSPKGISNVNITGNTNPNATKASPNIWSRSLSPVLLYVLVLFFFSFFLSFIFFPVALF